MMKVVVGKRRRGLWGANCRLVYLVWIASHKKMTSSYAMSIHCLS